MKFFQSALVLGLATSVFATPIPQDSNTDITKRLVELEDAVYGLVNEKREAKPDFLNHFETRATIKDTTCPDNGLTYPKDAIMGAVQAENQRTNPGTYGNQEGGGVKLFNTNDQLYKVSLDRTVRAVFSRKANGQYTYRGLIEHDKGLSNGFHLC